MTIADGLITVGKGGRTPFVLGARYGMLSVIEDLGTVYQRPGRKGTRMWLCRCDCGGTRQTTPGALRRDDGYRSCGCQRANRVGRSTKTKHGETRTPLYSVWSSMLDRCLRPKSHAWKDYGGRGIAVCNAWQSDYLAFKEWALIAGYVHGLSIDRIDNGGNYEPGNCRWITMEEQAYNKRPKRSGYTKRSAVNINLFGIIDNASGWARHPSCSVSSLAIIGRIDAGWEPYRAVFAPTKYGRKRKN